MTDPAIVVERLRSSVSSAFSLGPLSLVVPRGTVCALVGPNGAGKTTLLNLLMGLGRTDGGSATVLGNPVGTLGVAIRRRAAFVSPDISYGAWGTVGRSIDFVKGFYPDWNEARCEQLMVRFGLHRSVRIDALSFGARMKLALLMALSRDADLLLLDEPTIGLDPLARQLLFAELMCFMQSEARTIVIASHQLTELERFADYVAVMNRGQVVASGATPDLLERYTELDVLLTRDELPDQNGLQPLARDGNRARLLLDRSILDTERLRSDGIEVIGERALTLEELFVALIKSNSGLRWQPRMAAA